MNEYYLKTFPRYKIIELFFDEFSTIDIEIHRGQGILQVEKYLLTNSWWVRCQASVGLGKCVVDAYLLYKWEWDQWERYQDEGEVIGFRQYAGNIAYSLIFNIFFNEAPILRQRQPEEPVNHDQVCYYICLTLLINLIFRSY